jgi:hypothetical protein
MRPADCGLPQMAVRAIAANHPPGDHEPRPGTGRVSAAAVAHTRRRNQHAGIRRTGVQKRQGKKRAQTDGVEEAEAAPGTNQMAGDGCGSRQGVGASWRTQRAVTRGAHETDGPRQAHLGDLRG